METKPGPLDLKVLEGDLYRINSIGEFDVVDYRIVQRDGRDILQILIKDRAWGRTSARFGINLASDFQGNNGFELIAEVTRTSVNKQGGEWRLIGGLGQAALLRFEWFQPVAVARNCQIRTVRPGRAEGWTPIPRDPSVTFFVFK